MGVAEFDLIVISVGDIKLSLTVGHAQAVLEPDLIAKGVDIVENQQPLADDGVDTLVAPVEADRANGGSLTVGDEHVGTVGGQSAGLSKRGGGQRTVNLALGSGAGPDTDDVGLEVEPPDLVTAGHRDQQRGRPRLQDHGPGAIQ